MALFTKLALATLLFTSPITTAAPITTTSVVEIDDQLDLSTLGLNSKQWVLYNLNHDEIVDSQALDEQIKPASMTKLMTAILGIEAFSDYNQEVTISATALEGLLAADASVAGFAAGETVTLYDVLYGVLLPSGADATQTIALEVSKSIPAFVDLMNQKAAELGMTNTHFTNTHGLEDENHYSTVHDILLLLKYCYQNEVFKQLITVTEYTTTKTTQNPEGLTLRSTLLRYITTNSSNQYLFYDPYIQGGKTGFTEEAGLCLASFASFEDETYFFVSASAPRSENRNFTHIEDANLVYQTVYEAYHYVTLLTKDTDYGTTSIDKADQDFTLTYANDLQILRPIDEDPSSYTYTYTPASESFSAPLEISKLGTLTVTNADGETVYQETITSTSVIEKSLLWKVVDYAIIIGLILLIGLVALIAVLFIIRQLNIQKARKNRRVLRP